MKAIKVLLLSATLLMMVTTAWAEFEEIPYDWVEINPSQPGALPGTNTGITGDDQTMGPFPIGFTFPFYTPKTTTLVHSNGLLPFDDNYAYYYTNEPIPDPSTPNDFIAPFWDDLNPSSGGSIWYYSDVAGGRFIVEFFEVPHYSTGGSYTFEAILYENGDIDLMYKELIHGTALSNTVGIENGDGTVGVQVTYNGSGPLEPRDNMGIRIYSVAPPPPDMDITLVPVTYPIQIPATGGSFDFYGFVTNNETSAIEVDLWIDAIMPGGIYVGPLMGPVTANVEPGTMGWFRTQNVPGAAPTGLYEYYAKGGIYPEGIWAMDVIEFEKLETGDGAWVGNWNNWGDPLVEDPMSAPEALPQEFTMNPAHPNPFNPTTTLSFSLPEAARVTLTVYDVSGRMVTTLVNGWRDAGIHEAVFDGTKFASGVYIYNLTAGPFNATGKMVMMK